MVSKDGKHTPGPGNYEIPDSMGRQALSKMLSPPGTRFGTSKRGWSTKSEAPGPGEYSTTSSFGRQAASRKPSSPSFGTRTARRGVDMVSKDGKHTPGPGSYEAAEVDSIGSRARTKRGSLAFSMRGR